MLNKHAKSAQITIYTEIYANYEANVEFIHTE